MKEIDQLKTPDLTHLRSELLAYTLGKQALVLFAHGRPGREGEQGRAGLACAEAVAGMDGVAVNGRAVEAGQICRRRKVLGKHPAKALVEGNAFAFPQGEAPEGRKHVVHGLEREKWLHQHAGPPHRVRGRGGPPPLVSAFASRASSRRPEKLRDPC